MFGVVCGLLKYWRELTSAHVEKILYYGKGLELLLWCRNLSHSLHHFALLVTLPFK